MRQRARDRAPQVEQAVEARERPAPSRRLLNLKGRPDELSHPRRLLAGILGRMTAWPAAELANAAPLPPIAPGDIAVSDGHKPFLIGHTVDVQIYTCTAVPDGFTWKRDHGRDGPRTALHRRP